MIKIGETFLSYVYSGLFVTENTWIHPERTESTYELICVVEGMVHMEEEQRKYTLKKGDVMILRRGVKHKGFLESHGKTSFYWIHFSTNNFEEFELKTPVIHCFTNTALLKQIVHTANTPTYPSYSTDALLLILIGELAHLLKQNHTSELKIIYEAAEWIRINSWKRLTAKDIAQHYGYNPEYFARLFRRVFSMGLKEYICRERIKKACDILCNTSYSIKEISAMLGFDDGNQFIQFFKYHQGESPSKYRNKSYNIHMNAF